MPSQFVFTRLRRAYTELIFQYSSNTFHKILCYSCCNICSISIFGWYDNEKISILLALDRPRKKNLSNSEIFSWQDIIPWTIKSAKIVLFPGIIQLKISNFPHGSFLDDEPLKILPKKYPGWPWKTWWAWKSDLLGINKKVADFWKPTLKITIQTNIKL